MKTFFVERGYPSSLVDTALSKATNIPRLDTLRDPVSSTPRLDQTPLVLTHHPFNFPIRDVILKNFHILQNDPQTSSIFSDNPLVSFRHNKNIRDTLVHSSLQTNCSEPNGTFPCALANVKLVHLLTLAQLFRLQHLSFSSGTISHASLPTSSTASHVVNVVCFILEKLEDHEG